MIPLTVIGGFFGSGKTSLIAGVLDATAGRTIGVIVDEFGASALDGAYLRGGEHPHGPLPQLVRLLTGGRSGLEKRDAMRASLEEFTSLNPEAVVLETSGATPLGQLVRFLETDSAVARSYALDSVITVADATTLSSLLRDRETRPLVSNQLAAADLVVLNKADQVGRGTIRRLGRTVSRIARKASVGESEFCRIPLEEVLATGRRADAAPAATAPLADLPLLVAHDLHVARPFHPVRLHRWLEREWPGIVRVKGLAWLAPDMDGVYVIDVSGERREVGLDGTWYAALPENDRPNEPTVQRLIGTGAYGDRGQRISIVGAPAAVTRELRNLRACLLSGPEEDRGPAEWASIPNPIEARLTADTQSR